MIAIEQVHILLTNTRDIDELLVRKREASKQRKFVENFI